MKKLFLLLLCCPVVLAAQSGITISGFSVKSGTPSSTVTFTVNWNKPSVDSAWVFVDYNDNGTMKRLELQDAVLISSSAPGRVHMIPGNKQGVWVVPNAPVTGDFSATVQLLTATGTATADFPGACAYAIGQPPKGQYTAVNQITFTGTPPFYLAFNDDSPVTVSEKSQGSYTYNLGDKTLLSFTDASGAEGVIACKTPVAQILTVSAEGYCEGYDGVTFALSGTEDGAIYQLYKNDVAISSATLTGTGSPATFTNSFTAGAYRAEILPGAFCPANMSGTHTITEYPLPTITHLTGSTYQIVTLGEAIEPVKYTTMHATGASVTGLPDGLSGWWGDNKYTISGTPSVAGAFDYAVTAISAPQCTGANANHHGTVLSQSPSPCLGTAKTFNFGGYTWSDCIYINNLSYYCTYTTNSSGPTYYIYEGVQYVNPTCINKIKTVSCDAELGWSFPAYDQMPYQTWIGDEFNTAAGVRGLLVSGLYLGAYNATAGTQNGTAISLLCGATTGSKKCYSGFDEATWPEVQTVIRCIKKQ